MSPLNVLSNVLFALKRKHRKERKTNFSNFFLPQVRTSSKQQILKTHKLPKIGLSQKIKNYFIGIISSKQCLKKVVATGTVVIFHSNEKRTEASGSGYISQKSAQRRQNRLRSQVLIKELTWFGAEQKNRQNISLVRTNVRIPPVI